MPYVKTVWTETTPITVERLNKLETQYDITMSEVGTGAMDAINAHKSQSAPHTGHATVTALNNHTSAVAPHTGHVKGTMRITASTTAPTTPTVGDIWIEV